MVKIESTIEKTFEDVCRKKKVSVEDLQGWLLGEIDTRVIGKIKESENRGEERWKMLGR